MRSFSADRLRPKWADLIVVLFLIGVAVGMLFLLRPTSGGELTAVIKIDGVEVARQKLDGLTEPVMLEVEGVQYPITVEFAPGRVRIHDTQCPSRDCYATGWVDWAGGQIICLPNRMAIAVLGEKTSDIDAVTG